MKLVKRAFFIALLPLLFLSYNNCSQSKTVFTSVNGTVVIGNPMTPVSNELLFALCGVINRCNPQVSLDNCKSALLSVGGFNTPLGLPSSYDTLSSIFQGEAAGSLTGNTSAGSTCYDTINALSCSNPSVAGAYNPANSSPFAGTPGMIPTASCNQVFSPGVNLEVPIELIDNGLSSNTTPMTFSRTRTSFNSTDYDGVASFTFEVIATNSDATSHNVLLVNSQGTSVATVSVPAATTLPTRLVTTFTPTLGANDYRVGLDGTNTAGQLNAFAGRILVKQVGATQTKIYVPLTGAYSTLTGASSGADDSTAAVDVADPNGSYNSFYWFSLWNKNNSNFSQLAANSPYTFEAVISTSTAGSTTAYASLFDYTTGNQVTTSEVSTTSTSPTLVTTSFSDSDVSFRNLDDFEMRVKNSGFGTSAWFYKAGLWIKLTNLTHAEVYYRYSKTIWQGAGTSEFQSNHDITLFDAALFGPNAMIFHEDTGYVTATGVPCTERPYDIGTADSGTTGAPVAGSDLTFTSTAKMRQRTSPLALTSGHRYISDVAANPTAGSCVLAQPRWVVRF